MKKVVRLALIPQPLLPKWAKGSRIQSPSPALVFKIQGGGLTGDALLVGQLREKLGDRLQILEDGILHEIDRPSHRRIAQG